MVCPFFFFFWQKYLCLVNHSEIVSRNGWWFSMANQWIDAKVIDKYLGAAGVPVFSSAWCCASLLHLCIELTCSSSCLALSQHSCRLARPGAAEELRFSCVTAQWPCTAICPAFWSCARRCLATLCSEICEIPGWLEHLVMFWMNVGERLITSSWTCEIKGEEFFRMREEQNYSQMDLVEEYTFLH